MRRLCVLGGSTPFTAALLDALAEAEGMPPFHLVLHGRDAGRLQSLGAYAARRLGPAGWAVGTSRELPAAVEGADVVVHQIRYGDLAGRAEDERFACAHGCPPDETLGPAALRCALRSRSGVRQSAAAIREGAPDAWVLNLTNPLSLTTSLIADRVGPRCLGVCELPEATAGLVAEALAVPYEELSWAYAGLNHRGFVYDLSVDGHDALDDLVRVADEVGGIDAERIAVLGAVPTKYFRLMTGLGPCYPGRAQEVERIRARIAADLARTPSRHPPNLDARPTPWYDRALVPILTALSSPDGGPVVATVSDGPGLALERRGHLSWSGFVPTPMPVPPPKAATWIRRYHAHEEALLHLVRTPSRGTLLQAIELDPVVPPARVGGIVDALARSLELATGPSSWGPYGKHVGDHGPPTVL